MPTATLHRTVKGHSYATAQPNRLYEENQMDFPHNRVIVVKAAAPRKREIGFLDGIAKVTFHEDWKMTPEELGMV
jgi:hypothetical protein